MENKKTKIISIISIIALVLTVITATYAYFQAQTGEGSQADVKINASTVDTLTFETGDPLSFTIDQDNFAKDQASLSASTFASATLSANNKTNTATDHYYMYLNISNNSFIYTQDENTPEMILTITSASGTPLTSIDGLTYKEVTDNKGTKISGFDITTKNGLIPLLSNKEISSSPKTEEKWNVTITFVNYNLDQSKNAGKDFTAKLMIQKEKMKDTVATVCSNGQTLNSCIIAMNGKDDTLYYHNANLENGAGDNSYRYAGPSDQVNNFVCFGSTTSPCPVDNLYRIIGVIDGKVKLIKYDYMTTDELGTDGDYLKIYKDWGMPETYKGTYGEGEKIGIYYWNYKADTEINSGLGSNTWSTSLLNKTNLNTNFINYIGEEWTNKIAVTTWKVGGNTYANIALKTPSVAYQNEILNPDATNSTDNATEYEAKIGLMYVSDYGFAINPSAWTFTMNDDTEDARTIISNSWIYMGLSEWTISRIADTSDCVLRVGITGSVGGDDMNTENNDHAVRVTFNLEPTITYKSGSGTMSDPILIN